MDTLGGGGGTNDTVLIAVENLLDNPPRDTVVFCYDFAIEVSEIILFIVLFSRGHTKVLRECLMK